MLLMEILFGSLTGAGLLGIIAFVILVFKIPEAAWHGHLSRLAYLCMFLGGGSAAFALTFYFTQIPERVRDYMDVPLVLLWGGAIGSFFGVLSYRRNGKAGGAQGTRPKG